MPCQFFQSRGLNTLQALHGLQLPPGQFGNNREVLPAGRYRNDGYVSYGFQCTCCQLFARIAPNQVFQIDTQLYKYQIKITIRSLGTEHVSCMCMILKKGIDLIAFNMVETEGMIHTLRQTAGINVISSNERLY